MKRSLWVILLVPFLPLGCGGDRQSPWTEEASVRLGNEATQGGYRLIGTQDLAEKVASRSNMILLDVRPAADFRKAHILGSTNIPFPADPMSSEWDPKRMDGLSAEQFARRLSKDPSIPLVIYSQNPTCPRSHTASLWAKRLGFQDVHRYAAGLEGWLQAGQETRSIKE